MASNRPTDGIFRREYEKNKKKILATHDICALCGKPVDKTIPYRNEKGEFNVWAATIDHIIPLAKGGHPSSIDNLQLTHFKCNRQKSDNLTASPKIEGPKLEKISNDILPLSMDWTTYRHS